MPYRDVMSEQSQARASAAGTVIAVSVMVVIFGALIAAIVIWGIAYVFAAIVLAAVAWAWMFRTEYNNPGWRDRR